MVVSMNSCPAPSVTVSPNINKLYLLLCYLRVPRQLASPPGFHVTHFLKGNLIFNKKLKNVSCENDRLNG